MFRSFKLEGIPKAEVLKGAKLRMPISVTRYWSKKVAQMFPKVAQIDAAAVFS